MKNAKSFLAILIVACGACVADATGLGQSFCGGQQVVLQQNVGHYGVQQFAQPVYAQQFVAPQRVFVQRQVVVNRGFRSRAVVVNRGFRSNVVVVRNRGFVPFFGFGFGF